MLMRADENGYVIGEFTGRWLPAGPAHLLRSSTRRSLLPWLVLNRRYPHRDAGRVAAPVFGLAGIIAGVVSASLIGNAPPPVANAALWAAIGGSVAYLVFSSEGPQKRPASVVQAGIADGVVAGVIVATMLILLDLFTGGGAGGSAGVPVTFGRVAEGFGSGVLSGAVGGGLLGYLVFLVGGREKLERRPTFSRRKAGKPKGGASRRRR